MIFLFGLSRLCVAIFTMRSFFEQRCKLKKASCKLMKDEYYKRALRQLLVNIRRKRPKLLWENSWYLHDDNAFAHALLQIHEFCAKNAMCVLPHPPCSPDLAPCDFFLIFLTEIYCKRTTFSNRSGNSRKHFERIAVIQTWGISLVFLPLEKTVTIMHLQNWGVFWRGWVMTQ